MGTTEQEDPGQHSARDRAKISLVKAFTTRSEKLTKSKVSCILFIICCYDC